MSFEELGSVLRAEREKRGLSLDNVAEHLKISARLLRALEEGDESSLPHTVYVRGFVRSYGNYLGLDSEELQAGMTGLSDEEQEVQPSHYVTPEPDSGRGAGKIFLLVFILLCAAGAAFFWFYRDADLFSELQQARLSTAQPAPPLNASPANAPSANARPEAASPATGQAAGQAAGQKSGAASSVPSASSASSAPAAAPAAPAAPAPAATGRPASQAEQAAASRMAAATQAQQAQQQTAAQNAATAPAVNQGAAQNTAPRDAAPVSGHHKIIITALAECWIHSNADSTDTRQFSLRKGDTFALTFADKLVLKLGNAGGVRIRYNGEDLPQQGKEGQVKTLTFPLAAQ